MIFGQDSKSERVERSCIVTVIYGIVKNCYNTFTELLHQFKYYYYNVTFVTFVMTAVRRVIIIHRVLWQNSKIDVTVHDVSCPNFKKCCNNNQSFHPSTFRVLSKNGKSRFLWKSWSRFGIFEQGPKHQICWNSINFFIKIEIFDFWTIL